MNAPKSLAHTPLGQTLLGTGLISEDQLRIALQEQGRVDRPLGRLLIELGFVSEAALRDALSESLGKQSVDLSSTIADADALALVPQELAKRHRLLPLHFDGNENRLTVAIGDINDVVALDALRGLLAEDIIIETLLAGDSEIVRAIDQYYGHKLSIDGILHEIETGEIDVRSLAATTDEYSQPVVRLIDALLANAVKRDASDIHFEPEAAFLRIRYRIDGILRQVRSLHKSYWAAMAVRVKVMAGLNIAETRAPQDGRISLNISGRPVDFRVSVQPTIHGENIVLRVLDRQKGIVDLDDLGLSEAQLDLLKLMIARPEGLILVTGPTGSGKTTTLYSILSHINAEGVNIMTLEDPVEYPMSMIRQTSVSEAVKLDFADGVRAMLRQDPDIILVGEIRDSETARMAFRAAMTGHQVYSTLHTHSAIGAIARLLDIGISPELLAGNIIGIVAQRLVRKLCVHCREPYTPEAWEVRLIGLPQERGAPMLHRAKGCPRCEFQGYRGRTALMELVRMDSDMDELVARRASVREIRNAARAKGFRALAEDGIRQVLDGVTSLDELARVVDLTERMA
ncbi:GspE/PulE family protein [Denitromonas iodatirespirans]|uniref:Flp pilus assembly complex ATPase component TadA n=1 Tax=Denitromonas iodatirespirans TaxID=2795389 RepID=A0A944HCF9_DENI1|nr:GspE/PulE family protein [Denitromonas iodatirespirans]MBT0962677.1 Flp pilus assembly complex ATPase component TadA [Denitromonas iodatirespirans]